MPSSVLYNIHSGKGKYTEVMEGTGAFNKAYAADDNAFKDIRRISLTSIEEKHKTTMESDAKVCGSAVDANLDMAYIKKDNEKALNETDKQLLRYFIHRF